MKEKVMEFKLEATNETSYHKCQECDDSNMPSHLYNDFHWRCDACGSVVTPYRGKDWRTGEPIDHIIPYTEPLLEYCWMCQEKTFQVVMGLYNDCGDHTKCCKCKKTVKDWGLTPEDF